MLYWPGWVRQDGFLGHRTPRQHVVRTKSIKQQTGTDTGLGPGFYISRSIISRSIVERHGGPGGVERDEGCGATFWLTLPLPI